MDMAFQDTVMHFLCLQGFTVCGVYVARVFKKKKKEKKREVLTGKHLLLTHFYLERVASCKAEINPL